MKFMIDRLPIVGGALKLFKGADDTLKNVRLLNDNGTPVDTTGATATIEIYDRVDRKNTAVASLALSVVTATAGAMSFTPTIANTNIAQGTYYVYVKHVVTAGTVVTVTTNYFTLVIG